MKRFSIVGIALLLLLVLAGCREYQGEPMKASEVDSTAEATAMDEALSLLNESISVDEEAYDEALKEALTNCPPAPAVLSFASLEDLLNACKTAREGGDISDFVSGWNPENTDRTLADTVGDLNLTALEKIFVPTNIPAPYQFKGIAVYKEGVGVQYTREDLNLVDAQLDKFAFSFSRLDRDSSMDEILRANHLTRKNLIEDMYLFEGTHSLRWMLDGREMSLSLPRPREVLFMEISVVEYLGLNSIEELTQFAEVDVIELG